MQKRLHKWIAVCAILCVAVIIAVASYRVKRDLLARQPAASSRLVAEYSSPRIVEDGNTVFVRVYTYISIVDGKHGERLAKKRYRIIALDTTDGTVREVYQNQFNRYLPGSKAQGFTFDGRYAPFSCNTDGRYVIIQDADPVLSTKYIQLHSVYLYDSEHQSLSLESVGDDGIPLRIRCDKSFVSDDGRYVVFSGYGRIMPGNPPDNLIYSQDRLSGKTILVHEGFLHAAARDGGYLLYAPSPLSKPPDAREYTSSKYLYCRKTKKHTPLHIATPGGESLNSSFDFAISRDGKYIAIGNQVGSKHNQLYLFNRITNKSIMISKSVGGDEGNADSARRSSLHIQLSDDGRFVLFESQASNLIADDYNKGNDLFRYDRVKDALERVSLGTNNQEFYGDELKSTQFHMSPTGRFVIFTHPTEGLLLRDCQTAVTTKLNLPQTKEFARLFPEYEEMASPESTKVSK